MSTLIGFCLLFFLSTGVNALGKESKKLLSTGTSVLDNSEEILPVEQAFLFSENIEGSRLYLNWDMPSGYYLYKDKFEITSNNGSVSSSLNFDSIAKEVSDPIFGDVEVFYNNARAFLEIDPSFNGDLKVSVTYQGCASGRLCYPPETVEVVSSVSSETPTPGLDNIVTDGLYIDDGAEPDPVSESVAKTDKNTPIGSELSSPLDLASLISSSSLIWTVSIFFILGLALTFTPCVLPMIPIVSSIVVGSGSNIGKKRSFNLSVSYVLGMSIVYTALGLLVGSLGADWNLQAAAQNPWVLGAFALLFFGLALSMFDLYEIRVPGFVQGFVESKGKGGSLPGAFSIGALSALAVSPCVSAPLAGALLYLSTTNDFVLSGLALFSLSLGMGLPLILIGTFGKAFAPKSGAWMLSVKYVFGFILLGTGLWMLSRTLPSDVSLFLWGSLGVAFAAFLFDTKNNLKRFKIVPVIGAALFLIWSVFVLAGAATGQGSATITAPLKGFAQEDESSKVELFRVVDTQGELEEILSEGRPVLVDVYADWCISCLVMDEEIFSQEEVQQLSGVIQFVKYDMTDFDADHKAFLNENSLIGPPALMFYDQAGNLIKEATLPGEIDLELFMAHTLTSVLPVIDQN